MIAPDRLSPVYRADDIRALEAKIFATAPQPPLMERAGLAAAELARGMLGGGRRVQVFAGPGNNGGDAFVVARHLKSWWYDVTVIFTGDRSRLPADAATAFDAWWTAGGKFTAPDAIPLHAHMIVDGLFGVGLRRPIVDGLHADLVQRINGADAPVLALDVPSGLDADTGEAAGACVRATRTITFLALKPGLLTRDGPDHAGIVTVAALGVDARTIHAAPGHRLDSSVITAALPRRSQNSHKGSFGDVAIVGGAAGMTGAALLAGRAALKLGAGRVFVGLRADGAPTLDLLQPELMLRPADTVVRQAGLRCLVVGPGLGTDDGAAALLATALDSSAVLLLDADALNLVAVDATLERRLRARTVPTLLTPHPAEAGRLLHRSTADVQHDRIAAAQALASRTDAWALVKGAGSIVAAPDGRWFVNTSGNPGLATGGMGDALAGIVGALVAQGTDPGVALLAGVHLHGLAGDALRESVGGPVGLTASEVIDAARTRLNALRYPID